MTVMDALIYSVLVIAVVLVAIYMYLAYKLNKSGRKVDLSPLYIGVLMILAGVYTVLS